MSHSVMMTSLLNELRGGEFDGWTREDIKTKRPDVWDARQLDKLNYRCEDRSMRGGSNEGGVSVSPGLTECPCYW